MTSWFTYHFSTLYTTLLKINVLILLKKHSKEKALITLHVMTEIRFFISKQPKKYHAWFCQTVCDALNFLLDILNLFGTKLYRKVVAIPIGTYCAPPPPPPPGDEFILFYERVFMMSLSYEKQANIIDDFSTTS